MTFEKIAHAPANRTCPGCGNPTPADRAECVHCGVVPVDVLVARQEEVKRFQFIEAVFTRASPFTLIFIGMNVAVFALMWLAGGMSVMSADRDILVAFGAKVNDLIRDQHQYWRLVTSVFVHIGLLHLFFNMYALWIVGQQIEQIYGSARFVLIYLGCGIAGSLASLFFSASVSAGASGAIFGLFGAMATFGLRYRKELPGRLGSDFIKGVLPVIAINLIFGFSTKIVDNAAHLGGLLTGVALCFLIPYQRPAEKQDAGAWRALLVASLVIIAVSFISAFIHYDGPPLSFANIIPHYEARKQALNEADKAFRDSVNSFGKIIDTRDEKADLSATRASVERAIQTLNGLPNIGSRGGQIRKRLLDLLTRQREVLDRHIQSKPKDWDKAEADERDLINRYQQFPDEFDTK